MAMHSWKDLASVPFLLNQTLIPNPFPAHQLNPYPYSLFRTSGQGHVFMARRCEADVSGLRRRVRRPAYILVAASRKMLPSRPCVWHHHLHLDCVGSLALLLSQVLVSSRGHRASRGLPSGGEAAKWGWCRAWPQALTDIIGAIKSIKDVGGWGGAGGGMGCSSKAKGGACGEWMAG